MDDISARAKRWRRAIYSMPYPRLPPSDDRATDNSLGRYSFVVDPARSIPTSGSANAGFVRPDMSQCVLYTSRRQEFGSLFSVRLNKTLTHIRIGPSALAVDVHEHVDVLTR